MKYTGLTLKVLLITFNLFYLNESCSQNDLKDYLGYRYFRILIDIQKDTALRDVRSDLGLFYSDKGEREFDSIYYGEYKLGRKFQCIVDLRDSFPNQFIYICNYSTKLENITNEIFERYSWTSITSRSQQLLLDWDETKKIEIENNDFDIKEYMIKLTNEKKARELKKKEKVLTSWKYFKIYARADDDSIFILVQDDMLYIDPKLESFTLVIDIQDTNQNNQFIILGDETDPSAMRFGWSQLSKRVQNGLINWTGTNKVNLIHVINNNIEVMSKMLETKTASNELKLFCYYERAQSYTKLDKYKEAILDYDKCIDLGMGMLNSNSMKGFFSVFPIDIESNVTWFVWHSRFRLAYEKRAEWYINSNRYRKAIIDYSNLLKLDTLKIYYYRQRSLAYEHNGEFEKSIKDFKNAIRLCNYFIEHNDNYWYYYINNEPGIAMFSETDEDNSELQYEKYIGFFEKEIQRINYRIQK